MTRIRHTRTATPIRTYTDPDDPQTRLLIPNQSGTSFLPFDRFAETVAAHRMQEGLHAHLAEEVVAYVLDGYVHHEDGSGRHQDLSSGSVLVLTAHKEFRHQLTMQPRQEGRSARWLSLVLRHPWHTQAPEDSLQISEAEDAVAGADGASRRPVVGPLARVVSPMGVECTDIEFNQKGNTSTRIDRESRAVAYGLFGAGTVAGRPIAAGEGALIEGPAELEIRGGPGYRLFLVSVPIRTEAGSVEARLPGGARFPGGRERPSEGP